MCSAVFNELEAFTIFAKGQIVEKEKDTNCVIYTRVSSKEQTSLIGYLLEGSTNETIAGVNSLLIKDKRDAETLKLKSDKRVNTLYTSTHLNIDVLKHLIFDFTSFSS